VGQGLSDGERGIWVWGMGFGVLIGWALAALGPIGRRGDWPMALLVAGLVAGIGRFLASRSREGPGR
jgi:hypothetical protein